MHKYAGIGSRSTPDNILNKMREVACLLAKEGWLLRSGGAEGADTAFEIGCMVASGKKEIFLPWYGFNNSNSPLISPSNEAYELAATIHPAWDKCSLGARALHARNCHQVYGGGLNDPVDVVICWTENGEVKGGTATAIKLAKKGNIPVINLATQDFDYNELLRILYKD